MRPAGSRHYSLSVCPARREKLLDSGQAIGAWDTDAAFQLRRPSATVAYRYDIPESFVSYCFISYLLFLTRLAFHMGFPFTLRSLE